MDVGRLSAASDVVEEAFVRHLSLDGMLGGRPLLGLLRKNERKEAADGLK